MRVLAVARQEIQRSGWAVEDKLGKAHWLMAMTPSKTSICLGRGVDAGVFQSFPESVQSAAFPSCDFLSLDNEGRFWRRL